MKVLGVESQGAYIEKGSQTLQIDGVKFQFLPDMVGNTVSVGGGYLSTVTIKKVIDATHAVLSEAAMMTASNTSVIVYGDDDRKHEHDTIRITSVQEQKENTQTQVETLISGCFSYASWNPFNNAVQLQFNKGRKIQYKNMPRRVFEALITSPSAGKFYNTNIRKKYQ